MLAQPCFDGDAPGFEVWCDAADFSTGAVLLQGGRVIAFQASALHQTERNYTIGEKGASRCGACTRCVALLFGGAVKVMTDHAPNTFMPTQATLFRRQARWSEFLQRFRTLEWHYKPRRINVADPVSRSPALHANVSAVDLAAKGWQDWLKRTQRRATDVPVGPDNISDERPAGVLCATRIARAPAAAVPDVGPAAPDAEPPRLPARSLLDRIRDGYASDVHFAGDGPPGGTFEDGLWKHGEQRAVLVPNDTQLRADIIKEAHDSPACGHMGMNATHDRLRPWFSWKHGDMNLRQHVEHYVGLCEPCQRNTSSNLKLAGLLHPLPVPEGAWLSIGVDFVTGLPRTVSGSDMLMTVVDRFTKGVHLVPTVKTLTAEGCASLLFKHVYRLHA